MPRAYRDANRNQRNSRKNYIKVPALPLELSELQATAGKQLNVFFPLGSPICEVHG